MTELNFAAVSERVEPKSALTAAEVPANPLVEQWLGLHANSLQRDTKDNQADVVARQQDEQSIAGRNSQTMSSADKVKDDKGDLAGDLQAIGKQKGQPGDDQKNRDADLKIVGMDKEILAKYGDRLSAAQQEAIADDIEAKSRTSQNSNTDIAQENKYIAGDRHERAALKHGTTQQIDAADREQLELRKQDAELENGYVADNNRSMSADEKLLSLFGGLQFTGPR